MTQHESLRELASMLPRGGADEAARLVLQSSFDVTPAVDELFDTVTNLAGFVDPARHDAIRAEALRPVPRRAPRREQKWLCRW